MKKLAILFLSFFIAGQASAGFTLDPYIGYGYINVADDGPGEKDDTQGGTFVGGRVGYEILLWSMGLDVNTGSTDDLTRTNTGVYFGFDLPILLHFWGTWLLSSDLQFDKIDPNLDFKNGWTLGVGTTILPFVSLNFEYTDANYEYDLLGRTEDIDTDGYLFSVSWPLEW